MKEYEVRYHICLHSGEIILAEHTVLSDSPEQARRAARAKAAKVKPKKAVLKLMYVRIK